MKFEEKKLSDKEVASIFDIEENYFNDFKAKDITGKKLTKSVSGFANASGGEVYVGIREENDTKIKHWEGFNNIEDTNGLVQAVTDIIPLDNNCDISFLKHPVLETYEMDKGIVSFENEVIADSDIADVLDSQIYHYFCENNFSNVDYAMWLNKQKLAKDGKLTVAGLLLYAEEPQISLPKRSSIKIYRYQTSEYADRDALVSDPITIEGCAYEQIHESVSKTKEIIESIRKLGDGFENVEYPEETLHEIITNAVLHRDYSIATDIQIRIFDNRVEVESPGKLPGHVTVSNILSSQSARNPKLVRLINKFPNPPNKDVGEGLNTAFEAMTRLRLKEPKIIENDKSVLVVIRHEKLASPEEIIMQYLDEHDEINNRTGRTLTGIKSENTMKRAFWRLRDQDLIEMIPGRKGSAAAWRKIKKTVV